LDSGNREEKEATATANYKAGRLEREMRKLNTSWDPTERQTMGGATVIEADKVRDEEARD
jgi:hypothetical protein